MVPGGESACAFCRCSLPQVAEEGLLLIIQMVTELPPGPTGGGGGAGRPVEPTATELHRRVAHVLAAAGPAGCPRSKLAEACAGALHAGGGDGEEGDDDDDDDDDDRLDAAIAAVGAPGGKRSVRSTWLLLRG